ncbi:hypothetical protein [Vibrio sp. R78045]|uniref:hypothetical protein n=1 Tax=Vibrio sp. R78045 TaxID=3093868 RepID=UPI0036F40AAD
MSTERLSSSQIDTIRVLSDKIQDKMLCEQGFKRIKEQKQNWLQYSERTKRTKFAFFVASTVIGIIVAITTVNLMPFLLDLMKSVFETKGVELSRNWTLLISAFFGVISANTVYQSIALPLFNLKKNVVSDDVWSIAKRRESYELFFRDFSKGSVGDGFFILNNMSYIKRDNLRRALFYVLVEMKDVKFAYPLAVYANKMLGFQDYQYAVSVGASLGCQYSMKAKQQLSVAPIWKKPIGWSMAQTLIDLEEVEK